MINLEINIMCRETLKIVYLFIYTASFSELKILDCIGYSNKKTDYPKNYIGS